MTELNFALRKGGKWNVYKNAENAKYNAGGYQLKLKIPVESVVDYCNYLMALADDPNCIQEVKMWNHDEKQEELVPCIVVKHNAKPRNNDDEGWFGYISPLAKDKAQGQAQQQKTVETTPTQVISSEVPF